MARHFKWSESKIEQFVREGRGKGTGASYLPWVQVSDFSSLGNSRRIASDLTNRVHHLLSNVEQQLFLLLEFSEDVVDIREQYPLPREETLEIAAHLGIRHPIYPGTRVPAVMSTDFLVTRLRNGTKTLEAYDCKRTEEAETSSSIEKLELHRAYFEGCEVAHHLVFSSMLPTNKVKSLEWIRSARLAQGEQEPFPGYYKQHCERMSYDLAQHTRSGSLSGYCDNYDVRTGAVPGTGLRVARMLLLNHELVTDMSQPDLAACPISMFQARKPAGLKLVPGG